MWRCAWISANSTSLDSSLVSQYLHCAHKCWIINGLLKIFREECFFMSSREVQKWSVQMNGTAPPGGEGPALQLVVTTSIKAASPFALFYLSSTKTSQRFGSKHLNIVLWEWVSLSFPAPRSAYLGAPCLPSSTWWWRQAYCSWPCTSSPSRCPPSGPRPGPRWWGYLEGLTQDRILVRNRKIVTLRSELFVTDRPLTAGISILWIYCSKINNPEYYNVCAASSIKH